MALTWLRCRPKTHPHGPGSASVSQAPRQVVPPRPKHCSSGLQHSSETSVHPAPRQNLCPRGPK
eukprot:5864969-Pyramimonas_sp.AAC.1